MLPGYTFLARFILYKPDKIFKNNKRLSQASITFNSNFLKKTIVYLCSYVYLGKV